MLHATLRRISPALACAALAIGGGLLGGATAVHGLRLNSYGNGIAPQVETAAVGESSAIDCSGCSDRDLGFRWAGRRNITSALDCPYDSWNFRRGCIDYATGSGL